MVRSARPDLERPKSILLTARTVLNMCFCPSFRRGPLRQVLHPPSSHPSSHVSSSSVGPVGSLSSPVFSRPTWDPESHKRETAVQRTTHTRWGVVSTCLFFTVSVVTFEARTPQITLFVFCTRSGTLNIGITPYNRTVCPSLRLTV